MATKNLPTNVTKMNEHSNVATFVCSLASLTMPNPILGWRLSVIEVYDLMAP